MSTPRPLQAQRKELGNQGEAVVARYLEKEGYTILCRNFLCKRGEIDLIAQKDEIISFVEVKTRKVAYFALSSVVTRSKQRKIIASAKSFLLSWGLSGYVYRFDVATVLVCGARQEVDYIPNAFTA